MTHAVDAIELTRRLNDWAALDIPLNPAQVAACAVIELPLDMTDLTALIDPPHRDFIRQHQRDAVTREQTIAFDPTAYCRYTRYGEERDVAPASLAVRRLARDYFANRPVQLARGQGRSEDAYPFRFEWLIALDPANSGIFSFIFNLQD